MSRTLKDRPYRMHRWPWITWMEPAGPKLARHVEELRQISGGSIAGPGWYRRMTIYRRERPEFRAWVATLSRDLSETDPPPLRYREYWD